MPYERKIILIAAGALTPVVITALLLAFLGDFPAKVQWTVLAVITVSVLAVTFYLHENLVYPLRTLSNLITALREEDYSLRARHTKRDDALGEAMVELNALATLMESRKLEAVEAAALLRGVLEQIDVAIFTFDDQGKLRLVNRAAERLLAQPAERIIGLTASQLGIGDLSQDATVDRTFPGGTGRWDVRQSTFRERGVPHRMLVIADITRALREEEVEAWRRIVRVLGHELNNSLAPIKSIAASLERLVTREELPDDWRDDLARGMRVIGTRTEALTRFTRAYAQLARLPEPRKRDVRLRDLVQRIAALETRVPVSLAGPELVVRADEDQLEQLLINLVKNAADASLETGGNVTIEWRRAHDAVVICVADEGRGISGTANLFVPFFTTKPQGSGIGLFLSRQIAEAHGGTLSLENRADGRGAIATLRL
ncbi:MAG TPA: ATP-binding protein [Thermoanaerobaculia bacterium]|nr:ATP-binding protein [Thermoanaerobaculia bacterium]